MPRYVFSGEEVYKVMVNSGIWRHIRTTGDHVILRWHPPADHESEARVVSIPLHDELATGTLRGIAKDAGANDFKAFCEWIDRNR